MAASITELWTSNRSTARMCRVGKFISTLPEEDQETLNEMLSTISGYKVYNLLLTVDGIEASDLPAHSSFKTHAEGKCRCHR